MTYLYRFICVCIFLYYSISSTYGYGQLITTTNEKGYFPIVEKTHTASIFICPEDAKVVEISAILFSKDIEKVTGILPVLITGEQISDNYAIAIGTLGQSSLINSLTQKDLLDTTGLTNQWECYTIQVLDNPYPDVVQLLVIAGSDERGTAYGLFDLSQQMGVSPWYWWADIPVKHKDKLYVKTKKFVSGTPSVKYRGIFLNDEDWGLQPWAAKTFEPETGDIGPKTYAKIFELLLRLKANFIWPAMHNCTKAFFYYPENKKVADDYAIVIGTSHAEPMLRNNVDEWDKTTMGEFNYGNNKERVYAYWEKRARESNQMEVIYTVGMRGIHDSGMRGFKDMKQKVNALENIIQDQRNILREHVNKNVELIPQAFTPYKEVLTIYDNHLKLPEDITIVWTDDNYGYIRRLNNQAERQRKGGSGVYYHVSYWGRPHDYLWLSTTHPILIWEEMSKAFELDAKKIWVVNVGDIKPAEYNMQLFLDMAYNISKFQDESEVWDHHNQWAKSILAEKSEEITDLFKSYYHLAFQRKPEFMGWSQTEPITEVRSTEFQHFYYNDEAQHRIDKYTELIMQVNDLKRYVQPNNQDAFFELVEYPAKCAAYMNHKFLFLEKAHMYAEQGRMSANTYVAIAKAAYDSIVALTSYYNHTLAKGKWNHMMSIAPRKLPVFKEPAWPAYNIPDSTHWGICTEGYTCKNTIGAKDTFTLPSFYKGDNKTCFIDIYLKGKGAFDWEATSSNDWISLSENKGSLSDNTGSREKRIWVSPDWNKIPKGDSISGFVIISGNDTDKNVQIIAKDISRKSIAEKKLFHEMNNQVSMDAAHYYQKSEAGWKIMNNFGYAGKVLASDISYFNNQNIKKEAPWVNYLFQSESKGACKIKIYCIPTHPVNTEYSLKLAVDLKEYLKNDSMGDDTVLNYRTFGRSEQWKLNVLSNNYMQEVEYKLKKDTPYILNLRALDPSILIDRIEIEFGNLPKAYTAIPETKISY